LKLSRMCIYIEKDNYKLSTTKKNHILY